MTTERREFLARAAAGLATAGLAGFAPSGLIEAHAASRPAGDVPPARFGRKQGATGKRGMAVTAHPIATRAAVDILKAGGNACDGALAASVMQTVVEPHMTTITGCLSLLYYDAATKKSSYINGGITAPLAGLPGFSAADLRTGRGAG